MNDEERVRAVRRADDTARHYGEDADRAARRHAERVEVDPDTIDDAWRLARRKDISFADALRRVLLPAQKRSGKVW